MKKTVEKTGFRTYMKTGRTKLPAGEITPPRATTYHEKVARAFKAASSKTGTFSTRYAK